MPLPPLCLLTPRLRLRPYEPADAPAFFALLHHNRDRLRAAFPDRLRAVPIPENARPVLAEFADDWRTGRFYVLGIWHRATANYLGDICLMPQPKGQAEIGYYLAREAEGQGYAREALAAITTLGFEAVQARRLLIRCYADNARGQAVAVAAGFRLLPPAAPRFWPWQTAHAGIRHFVREA